ncbi:30S ribosomal protein S6 [bacterium]|jgi:small subunit ribosomal protein S6|nr:30S ribosomal protein S6 [bacterium]
MSAATRDTGVLPGYETTFITRAEMTDDAVKALQERLNGVVASFNGKLVLSEDWGKRRLAYPIQKESRGQYNYFVYTGKGEVVHEIERNLRLHDHVLRFLTVNLEKEFDAEKFQKRREEIQAAAKRREEEREAKREERFGERRSHDYESRDRGPSAEDFEMDSGDGGGSESGN